MKPKRHWLIAIFLAILCGGVVSCSGTRPESPSPKTLKPTPGIPWFEEVAKEAKLDFVHFDCATPKNYIHETLPCGIGWIDYDNDGWVDLFCVQSGPVKPEKSDKSQPTNKLYRNRGDGTFEDVTEKVGLDRAGFHFGCAVGDYDNDGFDDLAVTYWGGIVLYHNESDGSGSRCFVDATATVGGLKNPHTATSCTWGDVDGDGFLDLYVCNYCEIDLKNYPKCELTVGGKRVVFQCTPTSLPKTTHKLFRNNRGKSFTDASASSGIASAPPAYGLAVITIDLDKDGKQDIFVANDLCQSYLFHNIGDGKFEEKAVLQGCGLAANGTPLAGMGIGAADVDGSGFPSLFVTNYHSKPNILFLQKRPLLFQDTSVQSGLGVPSMARLAFGTAILDADLDGHMDIAVANGHVERRITLLEGFPYAQPDQLFLGLGKGKFRVVSAQAGQYFQRKLVGRGVAVGDYNNDGRPDIAISNNAGPVVLLRNATENKNNWLVLELQGDGKKSNRNAIGARVEIVADGVKQTRFLSGGGSYLSANSRRSHVGLGRATVAQTVTVTWPSGREQIFRNLQCGKFWRLDEGQTTAKQTQIQKPS